MSREGGERGVVQGVDAVETTRDASVLEAVWRAHADELLRYGSVLVGPHDCDDVVSAAFVRASRGIDLGTVVNPRPYLYRAVLNEALNHRRAARARWSRDLHAVAERYTTPPTELHLEVRHAVAELSVRQRAVVYFAYWEDLPERAIAEQLGISVGSVRRHIVRATVHLRKALK
jgi:RNA polymerase sigma factor (sigma-70 family)